MIENALYVLLAYVIGSIPFGYLVGRLNGIDLREHGSKNIGATNTFRVLGIKWGLYVFLFDALKGLLPVLFMKCHLADGTGDGDTAQAVWVIGTLVAAVMGHTFTIFLKFKGGKGIATALGALFAFNVVLAGVALAVWFISMCLTRYVSLSSIFAAVSVFFACIATSFRDGEASADDIVNIAFITLLVILVIYRHRSNISRLCRGVEPRAFSKVK